MLFESAADARRAAENVRGKVFSAASWDFLEEERYVAELLSGELSLKDFIGKANRFEKAWSQAGAAPEEIRSVESGFGDSRFELQEAKASTDTFIHRSEATSAILAQLAGEDGEVRRFRSDVLNDVLLDADEQTVIDWILNTFRPAGDPQSATAVGVLLGWRHANPWSMRRPEPYGFPLGPIRELDEITERLILEYPWSKPQATYFVLIGYPPGARPLFYVRRLPQGTARIDLSVDATTDPRDVTELYRSLRRSVLGGRHRPLEEKAMALAKFVAEHPPGATWKQRLVAWNAANPDQAYGAESNFRRDANAARRRILQPWNKPGAAQGDAQ